MYPNYARTCDRQLSTQHIQQILVWIRYYRTKIFAKNKYVIYDISATRGCISSPNTIRTEIKSYHKFSVIFSKSQTDHNIQRRLSIFKTLKCISPLQNCRSAVWNFIVGRRNEISFWNKFNQSQCPKNLCSFFSVSRAPLSNTNRHSFDKSLIPDK